MLDGDETKQILYSVIEDEIGKEKIQTEITSGFYQLDGHYYPQQLTKTKK